MNLDMSYWKTFLLQDIFNIRYGANLELNTCEEAIVGDEINFVSRTESNNGVSAKVRLIPEVEPQKAGLITVAGGGSVLSTFVQNKPFYSGRDLYTLDAKENISDETKFFIITLIKANKYKYNYGRQANKTLPFIEIKLPVQNNKDGSITIDDNHEYSVDGYIPDWQFMEDYIKSLHHKPITTQNKGYSIDLKIQKWKEFYLKDMFDPVRGDRLTEEDRINGNIPFVTAGEFNEGVKSYISNPLIIANDAITIDMFCNSFYHKGEFSFDDNIITLKEKVGFKLSQFISIFISTIISQDAYRYQYGRQYRLKNFKNHRIKLPVILNSKTKEYEPDWQFMEDYIKFLPYGDRI